MIKSGRTDEELEEILQIVYLGYIPSREGGAYTEAKNQVSTL